MHIPTCLTYYPPNDVLAGSTRMLGMLFIRLVLEVLSIVVKGTVEVELQPKSTIAN